LFFRVLGPWCFGFSRVSIGCSCILSMYLGVPYAFINKVLLTNQKKKKSYVLAQKLKALKLDLKKLNEKVFGKISLTLG